MYQSKQCRVTALVRGAAALLVASWSISQASSFQLMHMSREYPCSLRLSYVSNGVQREYKILLQLHLSDSDHGCLVRIFIRVHWQPMSKKVIEQWRLMAALVSPPPSWVSAQLFGFCVAASCIAIMTVHVVRMFVGHSEVVKRTLFIFSPTRNVMASSMGTSLYCAMTT